DAWEFDPALAIESLSRQYEVASLDGLGIGDADALAVGAAGALLRYLRELQPGGVPHLARPIVERPDGIVPLDDMTRRNLELVESLRGQTGGTLLDVLDDTLTPMGARLLRQWLLAPLTDRTAVERRLSAVAALVANPLARSALRSALDGVRDLERLAGKAAAQRATPRELRALGDSIGRLRGVAEAVGRVAREAAPADAELFEATLGAWDDCADVGEPICRMLVERAPMAVGDE